MGSIRTFFKSNKCFTNVLDSVKLSQAQTQVIAMLQSDHKTDIKLLTTTVMKEMSTGDVTPTSSLDPSPTASVKSSRPGSATIPKDDTTLSRNVLNSNVALRIPSSDDAGAPGEVVVQPHDSTAVSTHLQTRRYPSQRPLKVSGVAEPRDMNQMTVYFSYPRVQGYALKPTTVARCEIRQFTPILESSTDSACLTIYQCSKEEFPAVLTMDKTKFPLLLMDSVYEKGSNLERVCFLSDLN